MSKKLFDALVRLASENDEVRPSLLPILKEAKRWQDAALKALAEEEGLWDEDDAEGEPFDADDVFRIYKSGFGNGIRVDAGRKEYLVFEDYDDAEKECQEYLEQTLEDEPGIFNRSFLRSHLSISPTDARMIAVEDADSYVEDIKGEDGDPPRVIEEADMEDKWSELDDERWELEERRDDIDRELLELDDELLDAEDAEEEGTKTMGPSAKEIQKKIDALNEESEQAVARIDEIEREKEDLIEEAADKLSSDLADRTEKEIKDDPLGWYEDRFGSIDMDRLPSFLSLDIREAAEDAIGTDGVAHFLASYDGDEMRLGRTGAVAYRVN